MIKLQDIKFRIGSSGQKGQENWAMCLIYIDSRTAMDELDAKFGQLNWRFDWEQILTDKWAIRGMLEVYNKELKEWIKFVDVGYPQEEKKRTDGDNSEWIKDAVSDALKRCSVQVGIGRELYDAPMLYTTETLINDKTGKVRGLTNTGKQMIQGSIDKWYANLSNSNLVK